jgi:ElaB/YqjD/DUF883 family membrane-anchored ribosome-binding protein
MDRGEIGDCVGKIADTTKEGIATTTDKLTGLARRSWTAAFRAGETIQAAAAEAAKQISDAADTTYRQGMQAGRHVGRKTAEQPFVALLIAGAIGFLIARMLHRR